MRTDEEIKLDVDAELGWAPDVEHARISVRVADGIVSLGGVVPTHFDRMQAESATRRVHGVCGIVNDIKVVPAPTALRTDLQIARDAIDDIRADMPAVADDVQVIVRAGHVTVAGTVTWQWQRERIESTVRAVKGVDVVTNLITVRPRIVAADVKRRIEDAFRRSAEVDAQQITVETRDSEVILRGSVHSLHEKDEAQRTAWRAPGVTRVVNDIVVKP
jgi:osmotically-inducible protein OsmY